MNDHLQQELAAWLSRLREATDAGASFALEQAPLIVQEKVAYGRVVLTSWTVLLLAASMLSAYVVWRHIRTAQVKRGEDYDFIDDTHPGVIIPFSIATALTLATGLGVATDAAQVWFAPRLYVLEWLAGLLK